eukprot:scpid105973/ scgid16436/ 
MSHNFGGFNASRRESATQQLQFPPNLLYQTISNLWARGCNCGYGSACALLPSFTELTCRHHALYSCTKVHNLAYQHTRFCLIRLSSDVISKLWVQELQLRMKAGFTPQGVLYLIFRSVEMFM